MKYVYHNTNTEVYVVYIYIHMWKCVYVCVLYIYMDQTHDNSPIRKVRKKIGIVTLKHLQSLQWCCSDVKIWHPRLTQDREASVADRAANEAADRNQNLPGDEDSSVRYMAKSMGKSVEHPQTKWWLMGYAKHGDGCWLNGIQYIIAQKYIVYIYICDYICILVYDRLYKLVLY